jgi:hypothetical protein
MVAGARRQGLGVAARHSVERAADLTLRGLKVEAGHAALLRQALAALPTLLKAAWLVARLLGAVVQEAPAMEVAQGFWCNRLESG